MTLIKIDSLPTTARSFAKELISFTWIDSTEKGEEEFSGEAYLLTEISYGASLRLLGARQGDEQSAYILAERVRFGDAGTDKVTVERARELIESGSPMIAAMMNAAWKRLMEIQKERGQQSDDTESEPAADVKH